MLQAGRGLGAGGRRRRTARRTSTTAYGAARVVPIVVDGATVGTASIRFPRNTLPPAERQLRDALTRTTVYGVLIAAAAALLVGFVVAEGITRPLRRLIARRAAARDAATAAPARTWSAPGELGELAAAVDTMAATLEREDELRRALTADVAHELRTPVTILTAQCEAILDGVTPPSSEQVGSLYEEVLRLGRVIEDLETLASAEAAGLRLDRVPVDLAALVDETTRLLAPQFEAAEVALATTLEPAIVEGDPLRLAQVVRNLLSNALKFTPAGGRVDVTLARRERARRADRRGHRRRHPAGRAPTRLRPLRGLLDQREAPRRIAASALTRYAATASAAGIAIAHARRPVAAPTSVARAA